MSATLPVIGTMRGPKARNVLPAHGLAPVVSGIAPGSPAFNPRAFEHTLKDLREMPRDWALSGTAASYLHGSGVFPKGRRRRRA